MEEQTKVDLLKLAAHLAHATVSSAAVSGSHQKNHADKIEAVFDDCVHAVLQAYKEIDETA